MALFFHAFLIQREVLTLLMLGSGCLHETSLVLQYIIGGFYLAIEAFLRSSHRFPPT